MGIYGEPVVLEYRTPGVGPMKRTFLIVAATTLQLAAATVAFCQPANTIPTAPILPIEPTPARPAGPVTPPQPALPPTGILARAPNGSASAAGAPPSGPAPLNTYDKPSAENNDERLAIWNSPEMLEARAYVLEYSKRSAKTNPKEAQQ